MNERKSINQSVNLFTKAGCQCPVVHSLPDYVVDVDSVDLFKTRLDNFWRCHDAVYNWTADLAGIGDRSEFVTLNE